MEYPIFLNDLEQETFRGLRQLTERSAVGWIRDYKPKYLDRMLAVINHSEKLPLNHQEKRLLALLDRQPPDYPRWEDDALPRDTLTMALLAKRRPLFRKLLAQKGTLTRKEACRLAPLTFCWAPDLLEEILDRCPAEELYLVYQPLCQRGYPEVKWFLTGSLLTAAAALEDLPSLEVLLARGYFPTWGSRPQRRQLAEWFLHRTAEGNTGVLSFSLLQYADGNDPKNPAGRSPLEKLEKADPLSTAIYCGSPRCALRLLREEDVTLTHVVRRVIAAALTRETQCPEAAETARQVLRALRLAPEELLSPKDFPKEENLWRTAIYQAVLRQARTVPDADVSEALLTAMEVPESQDAIEARSFLKTVPPEQTARILQAFSNMYSADQPGQGDRDAENLAISLSLARSLNLPLVRCAIRPDTPWPRLREFLRVYDLSYPTPDCCVSGAAMAVLRVALRDRQEALSDPNVIRLLRTEDRKLLRRFARRNRLPFWELLELRLDSPLESPTAEDFLASLPRKQAAQAVVSYLNAASWDYRYLPEHGEGASAPDILLPAVKKLGLPLPRAISFTEMSWPLLSRVLDSFALEKPPASRPLCSAAKALLHFAADGAHFYETLFHPTAAALLREKDFRALAAYIDASRIGHRFETDILRELLASGDPGPWTEDSVIRALRNLSSDTAVRCLLRQIRRLTVDRAQEHTETASRALSYALSIAGALRLPLGRQDSLFPLRLSWGEMRPILDAFAPGEPVGQFSRLGRLLLAAAREISPAVVMRCPHAARVLATEPRPELMMAAIEIDRNLWFNLEGLLPPAEDDKKEDAYAL